MNLVSFSDTLRAHPLFEIENIGMHKEYKLYKDSNDEALVGDVVRLAGTTDHPYTVVALDGRGRMRFDSDSPWDLQRDPYPWVVVHFELVERAQRPTARYASGEEPKKGDLVRVTKTGAERYVDSPGAHGFIYQEGDVLAEEQWFYSECTLIRRGETQYKNSFASAQALIAQRPGLVTPEQREAALRPILGHDRNGREVRRGDVGINARTKQWGTFVGDLFTDGDFIDDENFLPRRFPVWNVELLEEKAETGRINYDCDWPGSGTVPIAVLEALESFSRWLARPTLAERFEAFKARALEELRDCPALILTFDCDQRRGPHVLVEHPDLEPWVCGESYTHAAFSEFIADTERKLGRKALAK